jgi:hypothetical protein
MKKQQDGMYGKNNKKDYLGGVCVKGMGKLLSPHCLAEAFAKLLKKHNLRENSLSRSSSPVCQAHNKK